MSYTFQYRRDTAANWSAKNPVLADGEPGYDKTNHILKMGDGVTQWSNLPSFRDQSYNDATYTGTSTPSYGRAVYTSGEAVTVPMSVAPNGIEGPPVAMAVGGLGVELETPMETTVTSLTWRFYEGTGTAKTQIGTDLVMPASRLQVALNGLTWTWQPTSRLYAVCVSQQGGQASSFLGQVVTVRVAFGAGAQIATPATPPQPTLSAASLADRASLTLALPVSVVSGVLFRDAKPYRELAQETTAFDDLLSAGESHTYQLASRGLAVLSALTSPVTATATGGGGGGGAGTFTGFAAGVASPTGFGPLVVGTGGVTPTTAPVDAMADVNGVRAWVLTSGNVGSGNKNDMLGREFTDDSAAHYNWDVQYRYGFSDPTGQFDLNVVANHISSTFPYTSVIGARVQPDGITVYCKSTTGGAATVGGASVTIPANTFQPVLAKTANNAAVTADATHDYGVRLAVSDPGNGTLVARVYQGTAAQLATNALPQLGADIVINSAAKAGIPAGWHWPVSYGKTGAGQTGTQSTRLSVYTIKVS